MILRRCYKIRCIYSAVVSYSVMCLIYSFAIVPANARAQAVSDTTSRDRYVVGNGLSEDGGSNKALGGGGLSDDDDDVEVTPIRFSPEDVQLQTRYRPRENDSLFPSKFWKRLYLGVGGGVMALSDNVGSVGNVNFSGYVGYRFNPIHSLRLHGNMTIYKYDNGSKSTWSVGAGVDYLANLTNFAWGYNRSRLVDISTVMGGGIRYSRVGLPSRLSPYAYAGIHADMYLSSNFTFFVEPYVGIQRRMPTLFGRPNWEYWDLMYGVNAGLQLALDKRTDHFAAADSIYRKLFIDSSIGIAVPKTQSDIMHRSGVGYQAALGMWINPILGLRFGAQAQTFYWSSNMADLYGVSVRTSNAQAMVSGRAELLLNPLNFFRRWRNTRGGHDFDMNVSLGGDVGINVRSDDTNVAGGSYRGRYYGFTGALQAMYRIAAPGTYIFLEPRYVAAMYNVPYNKVNGGGSTTDHVLALNVGTRLYMTGSSNAEQKDKEFTRHWWAGADMGGVKWQRTVHRTTGGLGINPAVSLSLGYDWTRFVTLRGQWSYQRLYDTRDSHYYGYDSNGKRRSGRGLWNSAYDIMDFRLAYMLNLNNLFQEYSNRRGFNLWLSAGPAISYVFNESDAWVNGQENELPSLDFQKLTDERDGKISPALYASVMAAFRVAPQYEITVEAMGQYNIFSGVNPGTRPLFNNAKYGLAVGTRYHFVPGMIGSYKGVKDKRFFFDGTFSWASGSLTDFFHLGGTQYNLALGMWFTPVLGARIGGNAQTVRYSSADVAWNGQSMRRSESMLAVGARAELMLNPLNLFQQWRDKEGGHDFETNILVGAEAGAISKLPKRSLNLYYGLTGGLQFLYRVNNPGTYIFLEPRILAVRYNDTYKNTGVVSNKINDLYSLGIGTRIYITKSSVAPVNRDRMVPHWWTAFNLGGVKQQRSNALHHPDGIGWNPTVAVSVGYDHRPLASFRAQLSYQRLKEYTLSEYSGVNDQGVREKGEGLWERAYNAIELHADYLFNINNLLQGYDAKRKFNIWLAAGPALTVLAGDSKSWVEGQTSNPQSLKSLRVGGGSVTSKMSPAVSASMISTLKIASNVDLMAEIQGQFNVYRGANPFLLGNSGAYMMPNKIKYGLSVGARYHFAQDALRNLFVGTASKPWQKGWFLDASYGWAMPISRELVLHGSGCGMFASVGYWFNSLLGARLTLGGSQSYYGKTDFKAVMASNGGMQIHAPYSDYRSLLMLGGRAELMLNPLNLGRARREADKPSRWDWNLSAGVNFGYMLKAHSFFGRYAGVTASTAVLYRVSSVTQLYLEPRVDIYKYSRYNSGLLYNESSSDKMFTLSVGARVSRPVGEPRDSKRPTDREQRSHRGWWAGVGLGGVKMVQLLRVSANGMPVQPSVGFNGGYDISRLSTVRAHLSYDVQSRQMPNQPYEVTYEGNVKRYTGMIDNTFHQLDMELLYMFNASNLWTGYDKRNAFNVYVETGPLVSAMLSHSYSLADGEAIRGDGFRYLGTRYGGKISLGMVAGVLMAIPVNRHWDITSEVMGKYYLNRSYMPEYAPNFLNGVKVNFSVGTRYNF